MKIIFIGCVEFSLRTLETTVKAGGDVVGICTMQKSTFNADFSDLSHFASQNGIPYQYTNDINSPETVNWISSFKPDVIFCFGWSRIIKSELLSISRLGIVGYHPAALPLNRGRHPIIWALALGLKETASTFFFMDQGTDSGDILSQVYIRLDDGDNARTLYDKIVFTAQTQIKEFLPQLQTNSFQRMKQDHSYSNTWRKRNRNDGLIDWRMSSVTIHNLVRALGKPYVGAEFEHSGVSYKVWKTTVAGGVPDNLEPGKIVGVTDNHSIIVKCGVGAIELLLTEPKLSVSKGEYL